MDFSKVTIGYVPYLPDLSQPADRRRFPYFAKRHNIHYEIADKNKSYDIILLNASANLSQWLSYKRKYPETKFIFEMVDSLIFSFSIFHKLFKGIGWFILRKEKALYLDHKKLVIKWLKSADLVLCASSELRGIISKWNSNILITPDYLEHEYKLCKSDFSINHKMKLVWEGQPVVLRNFLSFRELLGKLSPFCELHIITNEKYSLYGRLFKKKVSSILNRLPIETTFHKWDLKGNCKVFSQCDCGIIPLNKRHLLGWHKPANKLVSFWFTGLPSVVSATPAYKELMENAGEDWYCNTNDEWIKKIEEIKNMSAAERKELALKNLSFVKNHFSDEVLDKIWFQAFENVADKTYNQFITTL
ncbi:MAG TPA: hypothetical protein VG847_02570 [Chitinophagaceae bacterium]|nr:hypothetical protein [Chitinophagaceae bacterium]